MTQTARPSGPLPADDVVAGSPGSATGWGWLCGVIGGVAGMAVADLTAYLIAPAGAPLPAVGSLIIDLLPAGMVNWGKETLGTADKPVLLVIIGLGVLALCGLAGRLEQRRPYGGGLVFAAIAAVGLIAVLTGGQASLRALVPTVLGLVAGYLVLRMLVGRLTTWSRTPEANPRTAEVTRRSFLIWTGVAGAAAVVGAVAGRLLMATAGAVEEARSRFTLPRPVKRDPLPIGADLEVDGLPPYVTPNDDFYRIDTALQVPIVSADDWSLKVSGMVDQEVTISFADLIAKPLVEHLTTLTCVSNEVGGDLIGNAVWLGYPIRELLATAGVQAGADMVLSTSEDGWTAGTPLSALTDPDRQSMLAVGMNGEALPVDHGYPVRMVVPGLYGYVSATKWVRELKVTTFADDMGYWTPLGWSALGPIKTASRIDVPRKRTLSAGQVVVAGVAWAQHTGISKVEVGIDGRWQEAELGEVTGADTWRQWRHRWDALPGRHQIAVRATDAQGEMQTEASAPPAPDGATGWHTITVEVD
ncbi:MAG TPA: molybdopterin-dependent oxidoreductase [Microlunatus sp.]|nr:molybdopterin-dependent oxidoreductase [Microlunatus sp.]